MPRRPTKGIESHEHSAPAAYGSFPAKIRSGPVEDDAPDYALPSGQRDSAYSHSGRADPRRECDASIPTLLMRRSTSGEHERIHSRTD